MNLIFGRDENNKSISKEVELLFDLKNKKNFISEILSNNVITGRSSSNVNSALLVNKLVVLMALRLSF